MDGVFHWENDLTTFHKVLPIDTESGVMPVNLDRTSCTVNCFPILKCTELVFHFYFTSLYFYFVCCLFCLCAFVWQGFTWISHHGNNKWCTTLTIIEFLWSLNNSNIISTVVFLLKSDWRPVVVSSMHVSHILYIVHSWRTLCFWSRICCCTPWCRYQACSSQHNCTCLTYNKIIKSEEWFRDEVVPERIKDLFYQLWVNNYCLYLCIVKW